MDDAALEVGHARPLGRVALGVAVVALAHPQEAGGDAEAARRCRCARLDGPAVVGARPGRRGDAVAVADVAGEVVLLDHLAHVVQDLVGGGDRRAGPRLEAIAEGVEVAVGADAGIAVGEPRAAEALLRSRARRSSCRGTAWSGDRRRRRRRCRRRRSARRNARWSWRTTARARWRYRAWACLSWRRSGELPSNIKGNAAQRSTCGPTFSFCELMRLSSSRPSA